MKYLLSLSILIMLSSGCYSSLDSGRYQGEITGERIAIDGTEANFVDTLDMDVSLVSARGKDRYLLNICGGFVSFFSDPLCLYEVEAIQDEADITAVDEFGWYADYGDAFCEGTELISLNGRVEDNLSLSATLTYTLSLISNGDSETCMSILADRTSRASATGTITLGGTAE